MKQSYGAHLNQSQVMAKHILFWRLFKVYKKAILLNQQSFRAVLTTPTN